MSVIIETSIGDFTVDLYTDERPRCCLNFLKLCKIKFYNFSLFHDVQNNLVAQTGDPTATGRGGESIFAKLYGEQARFFDMEVSPRIKHTKRGLVSMVNNGSGMHGSQFFITLAENLDYLDGKHTVFGEVAEGFDILDKLNNTFCGEDNRPHQDIRIYHTVILDDPYDDPENLVVPAMSPGPTEEMLNSDHIPCDADIDEDKGKTEVELAEIEAEKEAKANTQILEMVGDLPSADVAPPENVLFVCKLNPVTTAEDLEIIFSRFGKIVNCDVIKDSKTGESLQYAFIEFENPESCESAYFKMDNVLIDDRRIHVDFSQSVSKLKWKGKGKGVDILSSGDAPVYVLKNQQRQDNHYDLVYEDDIAEVKRSSKNKHRQGSRREQNISRSSQRDQTSESDRDRQHGGRQVRRERDSSRGRHSEQEVKDRGRDKRRRESEERHNFDGSRGRGYREGQRRDRRDERSEENKGGTKRSKKGGSSSDEDIRRNVEMEHNSDSESGGRRGRDEQLSKLKKKRKHSRDSSEAGSRNLAGYGSDAEAGRERRKKKKRRDSSESEISDTSDDQMKKHKNKKSKKHKKMSSDHENESHTHSQKQKKKKKRSKHSDRNASHS